MNILIITTTNIALMLPKELYRIRVLPWYFEGQIKFIPIVAARKENILIFKIGEQNDDT